MASLLGVVAAIGLTRGSGTDDTATRGPDADVPVVATVRLEPVTYRSDAPFTESIVTVADDELRELASSVAVREDGDAPISGDAAGLYAVTGGRPVCDLNRLAAALFADPDAAAAWASVVGVEPAAAAATVQSFTPVVLTRDTAVTNHTYRSGEANGYASILQAGTPVLVDENGTPRTQCSCGNPLLPPSEDAADIDDRTTFEGERWESFAPKQIVQVKPAPKALTTIDALDISTGKGRQAPVGAAVELDGVIATTPEGILVRADDGTFTEVLPDEASAAFDDGRGGLIYTLGESTSDPYERVYEPPSDAAQRSIWHLPAGANEAVQLVANDDPGIWHQLFGVGQLGGRTYVMFSPLHVEDAGSDAEYTAGPLVAMDLDTGGQRVLIEEAIGWEFGLGSLSFGGDRLAMEAGDHVNYWIVYDAQLNEVAVPCGSSDMAPEVADTCPRWGALDEQGNLNYFASGVGPEFQYYESDEIIVEDPLTRKVAARHPMNFGISTDHTQSGVTEVRRGKAVSWFHLGEGVDESSSMLIDVATGEPIEIPYEREVGRLSILKAPLRRPVQAEPPAPAPETTPAVNIMNALLPAGSCMDYQEQDSVPIQLSDGNGDTGVDSAEVGFVNAWVRPETTASLDVDADGAIDLVTAVVCNWGGSGSATSIVSLTATDPSAMTHAVPPFERYSKGDRDVETLTIDSEGVMTVTGPLWTENDATCCPSGKFTEKWRVVDGAWVEVD